MKDKRGSQLELVALREMENTGHGHQYKYLLIYQGDGFASITNKLLFNVFQNQTNHHTLITPSSTLEFITDINNPTYLTVPQSWFSYWYLLWILPLIGIASKLFNKRKFHYQIDEREP